MAQSNSKVVTSNQTGLHDRLDDYVKRHINNAYQKSYQSHNLEAFAELQQRLEQLESNHLILDSCCGTGMSSINLAKAHPQALVVGIDQSIHRLNKAEVEQALPQNCLLLRANCEDFWRLCAENQVTFDKHYILYPNPWPKSVHLKRRWHGHPVFPVLKDLSKVVELRSNWPLYLEEFARAWEILCGHRQVPQRLTIEQPLTLFEKKYHQSGQALFQLALSH